MVNLVLNANKTISMIVLMRADPAAKENLSAVMEQLDAFGKSDLPATLLNDENDGSNLAGITRQLGFEKHPPPAATIYSAFDKSVTFVDLIQSTMEIKTVPLNGLHVKLGAKMSPFAGFNMPVRYSSDIEEHMAVRNGVGVFDVSHMGEFTVNGPLALDLIQRVTSNDASKLADGQAQYSCLPNESGGIVDDLLVYKIKDNDYLLVVNAGNIEKDWMWINRFNTKGVDMKNISDEICLFAVQGPMATKALQKLTSIDLTAIKYYHFTIGEIAGVSDTIISNTGYTGAGGFELYVDKQYAEKLWSAIFEAGKAFDIKPIGLGARDTLRLEMGFCLYGNDIDDTTSPLEAGLGWITKFTKDFTNAANLKKQKEDGIKRKLVGFKMMEKGIPRHDYTINGPMGTAIGKVTSGTMSPVLGVGIGMGYVSTDYASPGTEIFIDVRGRSIKAQVSKLPLI